MDIERVPSLEELALNLLVEERRKLDAEAACREQQLMAKQGSASPLAPGEYLESFWRIRKEWLEKLLRAKLRIDTEIVRSAVKHPGKGHGLWLSKHVVPMVEDLTQALSARLELQARQWEVPKGVVENLKQKTAGFRQALLDEVKCAIAGLRAEGEQ